MAKKKTDAKQKDGKKQSYSLQSDAVNTLANADKEPVPEYSKEELEKYKSHSGIKIPANIKVLLVKAWFYGAVCYFIMWGLGLYISDELDLMFVLGFAIGMVTDLLINPLLRFFAEVEGDNDHWMMWPKKGMKSMALNILYGFVIMLMVFMTYYLINMAFAKGTDSVALGVEPILFGLLCMAFDTLFIGMKHTLQSIVRDAKQKASAAQ